MILVLELWSWKTKPILVLNPNLMAYNQIKNIPKQISLENNVLIKKILCQFSQTIEFVVVFTLNKIND